MYQFRNDLFCRCVPILEHLITVDMATMHFRIAQTGFISRNIFFSNSGGSMEQFGTYNILLRSCKVGQNNQWKAQGVPQLNNVAHPKHPEEEETSPNRNHIITGKQQQTN